MLNSEMIVREVVKNSYVISR